MTNYLVGKSIPRKEGRKKVTGAALYVDDIKFDGMLHGVTVRSSIARGRIKSISFEQPQATAATNGPDQPPAMLRTLTQPKRRKKLAVLTSFRGMNSRSLRPKIFRARTMSH